MMTLLLIALVWVAASVAFLLAIGRAASRQMPCLETANTVPQAVANRAA